MLTQVVDELRAGWPDRRIDCEVALTDDVVCDRARIGQLLSNLVGNALTHGAEAESVRVRAATADGAFELSVANAGSAIPAAITDRLFQPFYRGAGRETQEGLGLGLYIASEIARAHGGTLSVASPADETRFTFRMPLTPVPVAETLQPA